MRSVELDDDVTAFVAERLRRTAREFGKELPEISTPRLEWGDQPKLRARG